MLSGPISKSFNLQIPPYMSYQHKVPKYSPFLNAWETENVLFSSIGHAENCRSLDDSEDTAHQKKKKPFSITSIYKDKNPWGFCRIKQKSIAAFCFQQRQAKCLQEDAQVGHEGNNSPYCLASVTQSLCHSTRLQLTSTANSLWQEGDPHGSLTRSVFLNFCFFRLFPLFLLQDCSASLGLLWVHWSFYFSTGWLDFFCAQGQDTWLLDRIDLSSLNLFNPILKPSQSVSKTIYCVREFHKLSIN